MKVAERLAVAVREGVAALGEPRSADVAEAQYERRPIGN